MIDDSGNPGNSLRYPDGRLFVYGTLMFPEIVSALLDREVCLVSATLGGFERLAIDRGGKGAKGPVVFRAPGQRVDGVLLEGLSDSEQDMLDYFEEAAGGYELSLVEVTVEGRAEQVCAAVYEGTELLRRLVVGSWTTQAFEGAFLAHYLDERIPLLRREWNERRTQPEGSQ